MYYAGIRHSVFVNNLSFLRELSIAAAGGSYMIWLKA